MKYDRALVILPTYNESRNIENLVSEILSLPAGFDVLVIDDSSPDGTAGIVRRAAETCKRLYLIARESKMGLGTAYLHGFKWALDKGYGRIFTMDADFSHQPRYLPALAALLESNDLVLGSRYIENGGVEGWPLRRKLLSRGGNVYARLTTGLPIRDCTSGFMGLRRALLERILDEPPKSEGYAFVLELKHFAWKNNCRIAELPIVFVDRAAGISKISKKIIFEAFVRAVRLRFSKNSFQGRGNKSFKLLDRYVGIPLVWLLGYFKKKGGVSDTGARSILVIKLSALGDTVLLIPALRALRKRYPEAKITALGTKINDRIFKSCACVDETVTVDVKSVLKNPLKLLRLFKGRQFDVSLDFDQWLRLSPLLAMLSGAERRLGFKTEGQYRHYLYHRFVSHARERHELDCFMDLVGLLGCDAGNNELEFRVGEESSALAEEILSRSGVEKPFVMLHPETPAHAKQRQWPSENYIELGRRLGREFGYGLVISGTGKDIVSNRAIATAIGPAAIVLPPVNIDVFAGVLKKCKLLVCGNTGIMHLACAVGTPVVALHGPTNPVKWGPRGTAVKVVQSKSQCSPCLYLGFEYGCNENRCMKDIGVEEVEKAVRETVAQISRK